MKKIVLTFTAICTFAITAAYAQGREPVTTYGNRPSTQRVGQSGSNGTGEGVVHNMLNGTGDGLKNRDSRTYSQQLEEKGLLPSKSTPHVNPHHNEAPATTPGNANSGHGGAPPSEAEADVTPKH